MQKNVNGLIHKFLPPLMQFSRHHLFVGKQGKSRRNAVNLPMSCGSQKWKLIYMNTKENYYMKEYRLRVHW